MDVEPTISYGVQHGCFGHCWKQQGAAQSSRYRQKRYDIYNFTDLDENEWNVYNNSHGCKGKRKEKVPAVVINDWPVSLNLMEVVEERALPAELSDYSNKEDHSLIVHDTAWAVFTLQRTTIFFVGSLHING